MASTRPSSRYAFIDSVSSTSSASPSPSRGKNPSKNLSSLKRLISNSRSRRTPDPVNARDGQLLPGPRQDEIRRSCSREGQNRPEFRDGEEADGEEPHVQLKKPSDAGSSHRDGQLLPGARQDEIRRSCSREGQIRPEFQDGEEADGEEPHVQLKNPSDARSSHRNGQLLPGPRPGPSSKRDPAILQPGRPNPARISG